MRIYYIHYCLFLYFKNVFEKIYLFIYLLLQINIFLMFLDYFDALISNMIFKK